jgi:hypothetical protein
MSRPPSISTASPEKASETPEEPSEGSEAESPTVNELVYLNSYDLIEAGTTAAQSKCLEFV